MWCMVVHGGAWWCIDNPLFSLSLLSLSLLSSLFSLLSSLFSSLLSLFSLFSLLSLSLSLRPTEHPLHLQLDVNNLGGCAMRTRTYAKALHYKELEFRTNPSSCVGELIEINKELEQPSAAIGVIGKGPVNRRRHSFLSTSASASASDFLTSF